MDQVSHEPQGVVYEHIWNWMFFLITVLLVLVLSVELKFILNLFFSAEWFACNRILLIFMFDYLYNLFRWWLFFFFFSNKFHKQQLFFLSSLFYFLLFFFWHFTHVHSLRLRIAEKKVKVGTQLHHSVNENYSTTSAQCIMKAEGAGSFVLCAKRTVSSVF